MIGGLNPQKMSFTNLDTHVQGFAQFNPAELGEYIEAHYNDLPVMGSSYMPQQYQHTSNMEWSFELFFRAGRPMPYASGGNVATPALFRQYLLSLFYPSRAKAFSNIAGGAPSRVLFHWPQLITLSATVRSARLKHTLFNANGLPVHFTAAMVVHSIRDARLYSEDVLAMGTMGASASDPGY